MYLKSKNSEFQNTSRAKVFRKGLWWWWWKMMIVPTLLPLISLLLSLGYDVWFLTFESLFPSDLPILFLCYYCDTVSENLPPLSFGSWYCSAHPWFWFGSPSGALGPTISGFWEWGTWLFYLSNISRQRLCCSIWLGKTDGLLSKDGRKTWRVRTIHLLIKWNPFTHWYLIYFLFIMIHCVQKGSIQTNALWYEFQCQKQEYCERPMDVI